MVDLEAPQHFTKEQSEWIKEFVKTRCKKTRNVVIDDIKDMIHEIYHCQFYCYADMCEQEYPTAEMCMDCFYDTIDKRLGQLKGE